MKTHQIHLLKLAVDITLTVALLGLWSITLTGLALHEWFGVALIGVILVHLLFNWSWIVATTRRFVRALRTQVRINYVLNVALFVTMTIVIFSGLLISEVALPTLGLSGSPNMFLRFLHILSSDTLLVIVGLHLGMNWKWVVSTVRQLFTRSRHPRSLPAPQVAVLRAPSKLK